MFALQEKNEILAFINEHQLNIGGYQMNQKVAIIKAKIFNERKELRRKIKHIVSTIYGFNDNSFSSIR